MIATLIILFVLSVFFVIGRYGKSRKYRWVDCYKLRIFITSIILDRPRPRIGYFPERNYFNVELPIEITLKIIPKVDKEFEEVPGIIISIKVFNVISWVQIGGWI